MKPLKRCANGCHKPPKPPSLVICEDCLSGISDKLTQMIKKMEQPAAQDGSQDQDEGE
jgi:hypothetical protein